MLVSVDHGNHAIKTPFFSFVSGLSEHTSRPPLADELLEYDDRFWTLSGKRISYMRDKTQDDRFFISPFFLEGEIFFYEILSLFKKKRIVKGSLKSEGVHSTCTLTILYALTSTVPDLIAAGLSSGNRNNSKISRRHLLCAMTSPGTMRLP